MTESKHLTPARRQFSREKQSIPRSGNN